MDGVINSEYSGMHVRITFSSWQPLRSGRRGHTKGLISSVELNRFDFQVALSARQEGVWEGVGRMMTRGRKE